jgi:hypothetical protein
MGGVVWKDVVRMWRRSRFLGGARRLVGVLAVVGLTLGLNLPAFAASTNTDYLFVGLFVNIHNNASNCGAQSWTNATADISTSDYPKVYNGSESSAWVMVSDCTQSSNDWIQVGWTTYDGNILGNGTTSYFTQWNSGSSLGTTWVDTVGPAENTSHTYLVNNNGSVSSQGPWALMVDGTEVGGIEPTLAWSSTNTEAPSFMCEIDSTNAQSCGGTNDEVLFDNVYANYYSSGSGTVTEQYSNDTLGQFTPGWDQNCSCQSLAVGSSAWTTWDNGYTW